MLAGVLQATLSILSMTGVAVAASGYTSSPARLCARRAAPGLMRPLMHGRKRRIRAPSEIAH
ncbi:hypothetical protein EOS_11500 [Caballeronia mineralivorans PML1(12)]|uniref:Uncharacterized protein n=1 Tax=Caballeronia mineralivorans PML1(12) TaxID=908627 RepID=A0A0J1CZN9_9BURK|nr:hypothetical protein EOS_11500 [Caballeronia mineralivorans PML1(12)]